MFPIRRSRGSGGHQRYKERHLARSSLSKRGAELWRPDRAAPCQVIFIGRWIILAVTHLLLGDERGALAVRGVVGEVVREGFDPVPRGLPQDPVRDLK